MKLAVIDKNGKKVSEMDFKIKEDLRADIFKRAVISENSMFRQSQGIDPLAGKRQVINVSKKRKGFRTTYGSGGSRNPKKSMWARGTQHRFVGAFSPNSVGGRKAHGPKACKNLLKGLNNKEWFKALKIGVCASLDSKVVSDNGQKVPVAYPFVLEDSVEEILKTKDFSSILETVGFTEEIERTQIKKVRAGKGTMRNRTYKIKRGPIVVVSSLESPLLKSARNIQGFDVVTPDLLMVSDFGMGINPGRLVIFTKSAMENLIEEVLN